MLCIKQPEGHRGLSPRRTVRRENQELQKSGHYIGTEQLELMTPHLAFMTIAEESKELREVFPLAALKDLDIMYYHKAMRQQWCLKAVRIGSTHQELSMGFDQEVSSTKRSQDYAISLVNEKEYKNCNQRNLQ